MAERYDLFHDVKPYYGKSAILFEVRGKVPTLLSLTMKYIVDSKMEFGTVEPSLLKTKLDHCKKLEDFTGPHVIKCSACFKYYSKHKKFANHKCCRTTVNE